MRILQKAKDGGPDSPVDAYFLIEWKGLFSIALLKFNKGFRNAFHTHAFNAWTWFLKGNMREETYNSNTNYVYSRELLPKFTPREKNHRVIALEDSWAITFRGPWNSIWTEDENGVRTTLTNNRQVVRRDSSD